MKLINIGFGNMVSLQGLLHCKSQSAPIKRIIQEAKKKDLIDATYGRKKEL